METMHLISAMENFSMSFRHTSRVKYDVDFDNDSVQEIFEKMNLLATKLKTGDFNEVQVEHDFELDDVAHLIFILSELMKRYSEIFGNVPRSTKLHQLVRHLREKENSSPKKLVDEVLRELLQPKMGPGMSRASTDSIMYHYSG